MSDKLNHSKIQAFATAYQSLLPVLLSFQNTSLRKRTRLNREMVLFCSSMLLKWASHHYTWQQNDCGSKFYWHSRVFSTDEILTIRRMIGWYMQVHSYRS